MPERLTKDFGWKLFSVILAVVIWVTVRNFYQGPQLPGGAANSTVTYDNIPVYVVSTAADVRDFRVMPKAVSVTVRGPSEAMGILQANQIRATVDLTDYNPKDLRHHVDVSTPPEVTLVSIEPANVSVIIPSPPPH
jgi:YbbR domain-containing protein